MAGDSTSEVVKVCSACGLPPRKTKEGNLQPLKRCSRCKQAWYHDLTCQRKHFPTHKKTCTPRPPSQNASIVSGTLKVQKLVVEQREGRGNCLVTTSSIQKGRRIFTEAINGFCQPLVPPALHQDSRSSRCAFCFQRLQNRFFRYDNIRPRPQYMLLFCSPDCRDAGKSYSFPEEELAIGNLYERQGSGPPEIFSTSILLYRILVSTQSTDPGKHQTGEKLDKLQHRAKKAQSMESASDYHTQTVIATVVAMVQESKNLQLRLPPLGELTDMVNRIKINGFSICDGEYVAMGVGLYYMPSFMNHSCKPNTIQTFLYGQHKLPVVILTAFEDIRSGQEICISYVDNSCPRHIRRKRLSNDYFFWCSCEACKDDDYNSRLSGIKCPQCTNNTPAKLVESHAPSSQFFECSKCGNRNFEKPLELLRRFEEITASSLSVEQMRHGYGEMKEICFADSWYVHEAGERLVQVFLDLLAGQPENSAEQQSSAASALSLLEDLIDINVKSSSSHFFQKQIERYKAAKLRLFLVPDPRRAIQELEQVCESLSNFYPENHELIIGLTACLNGGLC